MNNFVIVMVASEKTVGVFSEKYNFDERVMGGGGRVKGVGGTQEGT